MIAFFWIAIVASVVFFVEMGICIAHIWGGKPSHRDDHAWFRLKHTLAVAFGQGRIRERWWGWFHAVIFYAFVVFLSGSFELLVQCIYPDWNWSHLIGESLAQINIWIQTYFAWLGIVAVVVLSVRRMICRKRVYASIDAYIILVCIGLILASHIVSVSCLISQGDMSAAGLPVTGALGHLWGSEAETVRHIAMGVHILCISFFLVWIPRGKHLHIFLAFPAIFSQYRRYDDAGSGIIGATTPDIAAYESALESAIEADVAESEWPSYGVVRWRDTTRKLRLEAMACTQCMRCSLVCPMVAAQIDDVKGPFETVLSLRQMCANRQGDGAKVVVGESVSLSELFACTQCGACDRACAIGVEHAARIVDLRRGAMTHESETGSIPEACHKVFGNFERSGNPWGYPRSNRMDWAKDVACGLESGAGNASRHVACDMASVRRILIFAGCFSSYDVKARKSLGLAIDWLVAQGYEVVRLEREMCCGEPLRKLGNEPAFVACMEANCAEIARTPHDVILTMCPHCAQTLSHDYAREGSRLRTMHLLEFLAQHAMAGLIRVDTQKAKEKRLDEVVMHLPCGLSKNADPRPILKFLKQLGITCIDSDVTQSHCCGGGGGQFFIRDENRIGLMRARELRAGGAKKIVSACPYCIDLLRDSCVKIEDERAKNDDKSASKDGNPLIDVSNVIDTVLELTSRKSRVVSRSEPTQ